MDTARSYSTFKSEIREWICENFERDASILDVGAGSGTYYNLLGDEFRNIDAVEVYAPNIKNYDLRNKYQNVYNENIVGFEYNYYDLIIFGDILEHLTIEDAQKVLNYACDRCKDLIVAVPYLLPQEANENAYEKHIQDDLTPEIMEERYPCLKPLFQNSAYGYYIKKEKSEERENTVKGQDEIDLLYVVGDNSRCNDYELKYSLRSIEQYGRNIRNVYVVGNCPEWLSDEVIKLPCEDFFKGDIKQYQKAQNIAKKVLYAIDNSDIGEEFLVSMDDHYYTDDVDFASYPYFVNRTPNKGFLPTDKNSDKRYFRFLAECDEELKKLNISTLYFTLHRNMHVSRKAVKECREIMESCFENKLPFEFFVLINNYRFTQGEIVPTFVNDVKIGGGSEWYKTSPDYSNVFSTFDFWPGSSLNVLMKGKYSTKSKYEK